MRDLGTKPRPNLLTNSSLGSMRTCERKYYLRYIAGLRSSFRSSALAIGSAFHRGIELQTPLAAAHTIRETANPAFPDTFVNESLEEKCVVVEAMVGAALSKWTSWPAAREEVFRVPLRAPSGWVSRSHDLAGVVDGWPDDDPASFWYSRIGEWKTTARLSDDYLLALQTKSQVSAYCFVASILLDRPIRSMVFRIVQKPTIRRRTKRSPESIEEYRTRLLQYYIERPELLMEIEILRTDEQLRDWAAEAWETSKRDRGFRKGSALPIMNDQSCAAIGRGRCTYLDLCARSVTEDAFDTVEDFHPEITAAMKENCSE